MMRNATTRIARLAPRRLSTAAANAQAIAAQIALLGFFLSALVIKMYHDIEEKSPEIANQVMGIVSEDNLAVVIFVFNIELDCHPLNDFLSYFL